MEIRALIVDDESHARENLHLLLQEYCPEVQVLALAGSATEAREALAHGNINCLFLDVKMPGEDGLSLLHSVDHNDLAVIFTTAHDEYALQAFRENAVDFLEKPIDPELLRRAVGKAHRLVGDPASADAHHSAIRVLMNDPDSPLSTRLAVPGRDGLTLVKHDDILFLEANDSYTTLHLRDGKRTISSKHIRVFETNLDAKRFFRVHKSYIINLEHLKGFSRTEGNMAVLVNGSLIPVSRRRLPDFLSLIQSF
ncbi:MAG: response regulator transcription factor [Flavobacteriales bacterium]|nr:response regulator transcription factor [Flavobacteriales bacterium]